ncbi:hypothetical protein GS462_21885 [Rhodococcus hoagii]|nr:hypothetical protein [Prescottella equi]MBM4653049.1 hypothetical protein [Prescottella equi]MBM4687682.1 hypothetical protein [Prescottella equi]
MKAALGWIGAFLVLALLLTYWKWLVGGLVLGLIIWGMYLAVAALSRKRRDHLNGVRAKNSALAARAQIQHDQYLEGDERGVYGNFRPEPLD